jgi:hypothetical protein
MIHLPLASRPDRAQEDRIRMSTPAKGKTVGVRVWGKEEDWGVLMTGS